VQLNSQPFLKLGAESYNSHKKTSLYYTCKHKDQPHALQADQTHNHKSQDIHLKG